MPRDPQPSLAHGNSVRLPPQGKPVARPSRKRRKARIYLLLSLSFFGASVWALFRQLQGLTFADIAMGFTSIPLPRLALAIGMTLIGYFILTFYDVVAFRVIGHPLRYRRIAITTFVSAVISANLGFHILTSAPLRLRLYMNYGLSALQVGKIIALNTVTFWLGYGILGGILFTFLPRFLPAVIPMKAMAVTATGVALLTATATYYVLSGLRSAVTFRGKTLRTPALGLTLVQGIVSSLDWFMFAAILYTLLPQSESVTLLHLLAVYLLAQVIGLISNVPGGLGVFETVVLFLMSPVIGAPRTMSVLLAYRLLVYVAPFFVALAVLLLHEMSAARRCRICLDPDIN